MLLALAEVVATKFIDILVKEKRFKPPYAEYFMTHTTKTLDLGQPGYDHFEDEMGLLRIAAAQCPVGLFLNFSILPNIYIQYVV